MSEREWVIKPVSGDDWIDEAVLELGPAGTTGSALCPSLEPIWAEAPYTSECLTRPERA